MKKSAAAYARTKQDKTLSIHLNYIVINLVMIFSKEYHNT